MPREIITVQVGQCGNQIGCRFWDLALQEHAAYNKSQVFDDALSTFFRNVDPKTGKEVMGTGGSKIKNLKARAVVVDMEEGVIHDMLRSPVYSQLFDSQQFITNSPGSGNNWAQGFAEHGPTYHDAILEKLRIAAEPCDSLQSFLLLHSLGGGTGSGVGSYILSLLEDEFPELYRFTISVFPSSDDDVITSPYNSILSINKLSQHADCIMPIDNQSLIEISKRMSDKKEMAARQFASSSSIPSSLQQEKDSLIVEKKKKNSSKPFDSMNTIAAQLMLNLTASMRFGGSLNVDLNEITVNLVPFPRMQFLVSSLAPLYAPQQLRYQPRTMDQMFTEAFSKDYQLIRSDPKRNTYLACALMIRGASVEMSDIRRNINKVSGNLSFPSWNQEGWKVGLCATPPLSQPHSLLTLANNCCIRDTLGDLYKQFNVLYSRKAHLHHYTRFLSDGDALFREAVETVTSVMDDYAKFSTSLSHTQTQGAVGEVGDAPRLVPIRLLSQKEPFF